MNQKGIIFPALAAIIGIAVIGVAAAVYFSRQDEQATQTPSVSSPAPEIAKEESAEPASDSDSNIFGTSADLLKSGQNLTCDFAHTDEDGAQAGTIYVASSPQRLRGDFEINHADGTNMTAHVIQEGNDNYFWSEQLAQGTKTTTSTSVSGDNVESQLVVNNVNQQDILSNQVDYTCRPWTVDNSLFNLPTDKEFVDLTQQVEQLNAANDDIKDAQCAACDSLQGSSAIQCKTALGCS